MFKKFALAMFAIFLCTSTALYVYSHCHTTTPCEDPGNDVVGTYYWDQPNGNRVDYWVNPDYYQQPSLTTDVKAASSEWTDVESNGSTVPLKFRFRDTTTYRDPGGLSDGVNVVGWENLGENSGIVARARLWVCGSGEIDEADIGFNYYYEFKAHGESGDKYCVRDVATHEFGHVAGLGHADVNHCAAYYYYTMRHPSPGKNIHWREDLTCEDKWSLKENYDRNLP